MNMIEVKLEGLALDITTNTPVVILSPTSLDKVLPIWIGHAEAWAIAMELSGQPPSIAPTMPTITFKTMPC